MSGITTDVNLLGFERWKFRLWNFFQCTAWVIRSFGQTRWEFICRQVNWCQQILIRARVKFTGRCLYVCLQRVFQFQRNLVCRYRSMSDTRRYAVWLNSSQFNVKVTAGPKVAKMADFKVCLLRWYTFNQETNGESWYSKTISKF